MALEKSDFNFISQLVQEKAAIQLEAGKEYLVETRLQPLAKANGFNTIAELVGKLKQESFNTLHRKVVEAMATHETTFFRDIHPFEVMKKTLLPELIKKRSAQKKLQIWCAASSSGQEPYSIAILLKENFPMLADWSVKVIATDISSFILARAREGCYSQLEVNRGLPAPLLVKYFKKNGLEWKVRDDIREMIEFRELNLIEPYNLSGKMDFVFIRNVLIYFDLKTKKSILEKIRGVMQPDGYLFLGGAETLLSMNLKFQRMQGEKTSYYLPT